MAEALATKYRPKEWEDVCGQESVVKILKRQLELGCFSNVYLFCGSSGAGKTTIGRILANRINGGDGSPIEIDGASNNGVDNVKSIITSAGERSIDSKYKIYIIDECHSLTNQAWQAFLKCIEEPPTYTIFIFCTTDPQKIPATILNRVQRFNITRIKSGDIKKRLIHICEAEGFTNYMDTCDYLSKICNGGMRDAICMLEKCASYDSDICLENSLKALGNYSYESFFKIMNAIIDGNEAVVVSEMNDFYNNGNDLKLFVDQFMAFVLDLNKYVLFKDMYVTKLPVNLEEEVKRCTLFDNSGSYYNYVLDKLLNLKQLTKNDADIRSTIEIGLLQVTRCQ